MLRFDVHGCTDVTGFGLIGHAREMALASGVTLEIESRRLRFLPGALDYARQGALPGGLKNNREFASCAVETAAALAPRNRETCFTIRRLRAAADRAARKAMPPRWSAPSKAPTASAGWWGGAKNRFACSEPASVIVTLDQAASAAGDALWGRDVCLPGSLELRM